jgi:hypothetical protein
MAVILGVAIAITTLLLPLSIYPGVVPELAFFALVSSPFWLPAAFVSLVAFGEMSQQDPDLLGPRPGRRRWLASGVLVLVLNGCLLWCGAPCRLAFLYARTEFEAFLAGAPSVSLGGGHIKQPLGVYSVERFAADPRGGVYFRTRTGPDRLRPNKVSYGFAYRPNQAGCPFGDQRYAVWHLVGDWYTFQASEQ